MKSKAQIRNATLNNRLAIPPEEIERKSRIIAGKIIESNLLANLKKISLYLPVKNEVETKDLINYLIEAGIDIYLPKFSGSQYELAKFVSWKDLVKGQYGILEPSVKMTVNPKDIDLVIFPGVAFDKKGIRLGYGKGIFDRLFAKSKAARVGLAYEFQILDELPRNSHDLAMNFVVTDEQVYRF